MRDVLIQRHRNYVTRVICFKWIVLQVHNISLTHFNNALFIWRVFCGI
jgi:hypothetical protein